MPRRPTKKQAQRLVRLALTDLRDLQQELDIVIPYHWEGAQGHLIQTKTLLGQASVQLTEVWERLNREGT